MIELIGEEGTSEYAAAVSIREALTKWWPETASSETDTVKLLVGAKISGYRISDIDVVLCADFRAGRRFLAKRALTDMDGRRVVNQPVEIPNLVVAIEVKDHDASGVRLNGDTIDVKYSRLGPVEWKSATQQNVDQLHALREYFADQLVAVYVHRLVVMRGLDQVKANGALPREFSWGDFLTQIAAVSRLSKTRGDFVLRSASQDMIVRALASPLFRKLAPTSLDRKRMDRIAARRDAAVEWQHLMGTKMLRFRGRGGSGKTVLLLELAWHVFEEKDERTLVLTYNHALAADIRRLMALLRVPEEPDTGGIAVQTVMSFMFHFFAGLQLFEGEEDTFLDQYEEHCSTAAAMFSAGAVGPADVQELIQAQPGRFDFDYVAVDEAQDWPAAELAVLKAFFGPKRILLADGVDQLVRGKRADWEKDVPAEDRLVIPLPRCLRMKANLAVFANKVAEYAGLNWSVAPSDEAGGGRVILLHGEFAAQPALQEELVSAARDAGNAEVDLLFCVPPGDVEILSGERTSQLGRSMAARGLTVWDGTNTARRRDFPRSADSYRIVQYASCRGLEGWTVVADGLDEFWAHCCRAKPKGPPGRDGATALQPWEDAAAEAAWRWCLIPLTRPIDTLVICLRDLNSEFAQVLLSVAERLPDIVEHYTPSSLRA